VLARALDFPTEFFFGDDVEQLRAEPASFRALSEMTASQRDAALAAGSLAVSLARWIDQRFVLPQPAIPDFKEAADAEAAANEVRVVWQLGERPIPNLLHLLEVHGVRIFSLVEECRGIDAFSCWLGGTPYVFLNTMKSAERSRFDAAHELGHLVLHRHGGPRSRGAEDQANVFASAFLMPASSTRASAPANPSLDRILAGKAQWGVSCAAYSFRLFKLGILSSWYYYELVRKMSRLGYRTKEPRPMRRETSQLLRKVFDQVRADGLSKADVAKELAIYPDELNKLLFGLTMTSIAGGTTDGRRRRRKDNLRLVTE
jgi:Zn-dependent peptidase ImmA (M78 family)